MTQQTNRWSQREKMLKQVHYCQLSVSKSLGARLLHMILEGCPPLPRPQLQCIYMCVDIMYTSRWPAWHLSSYSYVSKVWQYTIYRGPLDRYHCTPAVVYYVFVNIYRSEWVNGVLRHFRQFIFQSYRDGVCLWQILQVLPYSAASLEYPAAFILSWHQTNPVKNDCFIPSQCWVARRGSHLVM